jgi:hypothetical protein
MLSNEEKVLNLSLFLMKEKFFYLADVGIS